MPDPAQRPPEWRMRRVTEALMRHGHYDLIEEEPDCVQMARWDAEHLVAVPPTYDEIDALLIYVGLHDPNDCNDLCVRSVLEALDA